MFVYGVVVGAIVFEGLVWGVGNVVGGGVAVVCVFFLEPWKSLIVDMHFNFSHS